MADESDPSGLVAAYVGATAAGSYLALSHLTADDRPERAGLELVPPYAGAAPELTHVGLRGAEDPGRADTDDARWLHCGVARRP